MNGRGEETQDLLESFEQCKVFCKHFPDPLIVINEKGIILDGSDDMSDFFGKRIGEIVGKNIVELDLWSAENSARIKNVVKELFLQRMKKNVELEIKKEGAATYVKLLCQILTSRTSKKALAFLIFHDNTCARIAEQKLEESEYRYRELFDNMRSGVAVYVPINNGEDFKIVDFNKAAERSDKIRADEVVGHTIKEVFPLTEKIGFLDVLRRVLETGKAEYFPPTMYEDERIGKVWWEDYVYKLPSGEIVAAFANVTERMMVLEDLHKSMEQVSAERDKVKAIIENFADTILVLNESGEISMMNKSAETLLSIDKGEAIGKKYTDFMKFQFEDSKKDATNFVDHIIHAGKVIKSDHQLILINNDGEQKPVAYAISPFSKEKEMCGCIMALRDMTNERELDRLKTEFVSIASNQMHMPLTSAKWFLDLLLQGKAGPVPGQQRKYLEQIYASNERMISLVENLLVASHAGNGIASLVTKSTVDIVALVKKSIERNNDLILKNKINVQKDEGFPNSVIVHGDEKEIFRAVDALIGNAIRYSKPRGIVNIRLEHYQDSDILLSVKDNGYGIPARQQSRVFERFFRADNIVTKVTEGTGLSLFTAKNIIEANGGKIWFDSVEDVGTTFYLTLPKAQPKKRIRSRASSRRAKASQEEKI